MDYLARALELASSHQGQTGDNPSVGCVLVKDGRIIAEAVTALGGRPHAETQALETAGHAARSAHAYVTLEPCAHHGQTPPCTDALIRAGLAVCTIGYIDPDMRVCWQGAARLQEAGIDVRLDLRPVIKDFYTAYTKRR